MALKFADMVSEAERREKRSNVSRKAFEMELEDGYVVTVPYPDAQTTMELSTIPEGETKRVLFTLMKGRPSDYNRLMNEFDGKPIEILQVLTENMYDFWNNTSQIVPGKSKG